MIADSLQFKIDRHESLLSQDILLLRAWAKKYGVKLPKDDSEALAAAKTMPIWD